MYPFKFIEMPRLTHSLPHFTALSLVTACAAVRPTESYDPALAPPSPDYADPAYWAALPERDDLADLTPNGLEDRQAEAEVDVFFLHPTTYTSKRGYENWNGPVDWDELNERTDKSAIKYQASLFNGVGRVYAPRYRQAHIYSYFTEDTTSALEAFDLAYQDVKAAFEYYLEHYNQGRPIIIAAHSQGATHGKRLLKEFFDGKPLRNRLVVAYLVGMNIEKEEFVTIPPCQEPYSTGCFCSWRTFRYGKEPKKYVSPDIAVTNPLSWKTDGGSVPRSENKGAVLKDFERVRPAVSSAKVVEQLGILWTHRPRFFGSFFFFNGNYHAGDFNLYYLDVRENARERVGAFWK